MQQKTNQGWTSPSKNNHGRVDVNQYSEKARLNHVNVRPINLIGLVEHMKAKTFI